jgi:hypothetical protein
MIPQNIQTASGLVSATLEFLGALSMANKFFRSDALENLKVFLASLFNLKYGAEAAALAASLPELHAKTLRGLTWIAVGFLLQLVTNLAVLIFGTAS